MTIDHETKAILHQRDEEAHKMDDVAADTNEIQEHIEAIKDLNADILELQHKVNFHITEIERIQAGKPFPF